MSVTIELPPDLEDKLAAEANARGLSLPDYVVQLLAGPKVTTGADLVKYWQAEGLHR
jgi:HicB family